jgi:transposase
MPRQYPPEFRERIVALARSGRSVPVLSADYGVAGATIYRWLDQDRIDHGEKPGATSSQNTELAAARKRIRELEQELALVRKAAAIFDEQQKIHPKKGSIDVPVGHVTVTRPGSGGHSPPSFSIAREISASGE